MRGRVGRGGEGRGGSGDLRERCFNKRIVGEEMVEN